MVETSQDGAGKETTFLPEIFVLALIAALEIEIYATTNRQANRGKGRQEAETTTNPNPGAGVLDFPTLRGSYW